MNYRIKDETGNIYGRLIALKRVPKPPNSGKFQGAYWLCKCKCGNEVIVAGTRLRTGTTKSCGCLLKECQKLSFRKYSGDEQAFNMTYSHYKWSSKKRNFSFKLNKDDFRKLTSSPCVYCGKEPSQVKVSPTEGADNYTYNGIDRLDNSKGYLKSNCVPCCGRCNYIKSGVSVVDLIDHTHRLASHTDLLVRLCKKLVNNDHLLIK